MGKGSKHGKPKSGKTNGLPELAQVPRREKNGRRVREPHSREDQARMALAVRCSHAGVEPTPENIRDMRAPWNGCSAGKAMAASIPHHEERSDLWTAICHMRRVQASYDASIGAPSRHATCLRLLLPIEEMSADAASPALDDRSPEERVRSAVSAMMAVEGWLGWTDKAAASEAKRVVIDNDEVRDIHGLLSALRCVCDGISGARMVWRGRS